MINQNETLDSQNEETTADAEITTDTTEVVEDVTALKEKLSSTEEKNRQLFERAKKAEGFELKEGHWVKKEPKVESKPEPSVKSGELDYGQLAFYNSKSDSVKIEHEEDLEFLKGEMEKSGKSQQYLLENKYFISDLKDKQAGRATQEATPPSSGRSTTGTKNTDYWVAKYTAGTPINEIPQEVRSEVLNARLAQDERREKFTDNPVIQ